MNYPLLSVTGLAIRAGTRAIQKDISFRLEAGELAAVTGPSGSGKTTLLRTVAGLQDAVAGDVLFQGKAASIWGWPVFRRNVLLVSQQPALFEGSVEDNLRRPFLYRTSHSPYSPDRAVQILKLCGLAEEHLAQEARSLSIGQQQRVSLIRALLLEPPVLCLDEPTSALDEAAARDVQRLISDEAARRGMAALIVTHNKEQAEHWCSRRIALSGSGAER